MNSQKIKMRVFVVICLLTLCQFYQGVQAKLVMVQTLVRHGERAPDKVIALQSCKKVWTNPDAILTDYNAAPGRLTPLGVDKMRKIGQFLHQRYVNDLNFVSDDYQRNQGDWVFMARAGDRQQRSMDGVLAGLLPDEPAAIIVLPRTQDYYLGGPAPACGDTTAKMIVDWHKSKGWEMLKQHMSDVVAPFEEICGVNLTGNPVNAEPGGPNPHAWLGDISDSVDAAFANNVKMPPQITKKLHEKLTDLAFDIEQESHYEDPRGAIMFTAGFPDLVLSDFEKRSAAKKKKASKFPKMKLYSCSRELMYGLQHLFGWSTSLPGQPAGRVMSASTFIWELHVENGDYFVRTLHYHPSMGENIEQLQPDMPIPEYRAKLDAYTNKHGGPWYEICDFEHYNPFDNAHDPSFINPQYKKVVAKDTVVEDLAVDVDQSLDEFVGESFEAVAASNDAATPTEAKSKKGDAVADDAEDQNLTGWGAYSLVALFLIAGVLGFWSCRHRMLGYESV